MDGRLNDRAEKFLWSDANVGRLAERGSWTGRLEYIAHVMASWPGNYRQYAHPFGWNWMNQRMRRWFAKHAL